MQWPLLNASTFWNKAGNTILEASFLSMVLLPGFETKSTVVLTAEECRVFRSFIMKRVQILLKGVSKIIKRSGPVTLWQGVIERGIALLDVSEGGVNLDGDVALLGMLLNVGPAGGLRQVESILQWRS
jgi:hypothetical protein